MIEWRRVELHKIFSEELEEATRMGELEKSAAKSLQHDYFVCQVSKDGFSECYHLMFITISFLWY